VTKYELLTEVYSELKPTHTHCSECGRDIRTLHCVVLDGTAVCLICIGGQVVGSGRGKNTNTIAGLGRTNTTKKGSKL